MSVVITDPDALTNGAHVDFANQNTAENVSIKAYHALSYDYLSQRDDITRRDIMRDVLEQRTKDLKGCMFLPVTILFFCLYAYGLNLHEEINTVFYIESAIRQTMEESLGNVRTMSDVWNWLHGDFMNLMFVQEDLRGNKLPESEWSRVLTYNQVQGAVVLTQARQNGPEDDADDQGSWGQPINGTLDELTISWQENNEGFVSIADSDVDRRLALLREELRAEMAGSQATSDQQYEFHLYPNMPADKIRSRLNYLEQRGWLDSDTYNLQIMVLLLNAEFDRPLLERVLVSINFSRGGGVFYRVTLLPVFLEAFPSAMSKFVDAVWVIMLTGTSLSIIKTMWSALLARNFIFTIRRFSFLIEFFITGMGWSIVMAFAYLEYICVSDIRLKLGDLRRLMRGDQSERGSPSEVALASELLQESVETVFLPLSSYQTVSSWFTLFLMYRFFLAFRAQPRLALVVNTIKATSVDLLHFFVIFTPTFIAYVISGCLLFGRRLEEFSTIRASIGTCFRILIENEFEWEILSEEHFATTAIWTWTYLIVVVFIMLNMVLAIILDIYNEVRKKVDSADSIFQFASMLGRRIWVGRQWVNDKELNSLMSQFHGSTTITKDDLLGMVPNMSQAQVHMIFTKCKQKSAFELRQEMYRATFLKLMASIRISLDGVCEEVDMVSGDHHASPHEKSSSKKRHGKKTKKDRKNKAPRASVTSVANEIYATSGSSGEELTAFKSQGSFRGSEKRKNLRCIRGVSVAKEKDRMPEQEGRRLSMDNFIARASSDLKVNMSNGNDDSNAYRSEGALASESERLAVGEVRSTAGMVPSENSMKAGLSSDGEHASPAIPQGRMVGSARPFPGAPKAPGGMNPPLLAPEHASNERPDAEGRPEWLQQLDTALTSHDQGMLAMQVELQKLQWRLYNATQRVATSLHPETHQQGEAGTKSSPTKMRCMNGIPIL